MSDGSLNLEVNFRLPPLPAQVEHMREQMRMANEIICDATDGQIRLGQITFTHSDGQQEDSDIWWYPQGGRASSGGGLSAGNTHFTLYGYGIESNPCPPPCNGALAAGAAGSCDPDGDGTLDGCDRSLPVSTARSCDLDNNGVFDDCGSVWERLSTGATGHVIAHELGHLLFEVGDQYPEQNRGGGGCGIGPGFDGDAFWRTHDGPVAQTAAQQAAAGLDSVERNHTIMQQTGAQVCRDVTADNFSYFDKFPDFAGGFGCHTDADCQFASNGGHGLGPNWVCDAGATLMSEITVDANHDLLRGTSFTTPNAVTSCGMIGGARADTEIVFGGRVLESLDARCGNGAVESDEQCDGGTRTCTGLNTTLGTSFTGGSATCLSNCTFDLSACTIPGATADLCANTTLDPGEQCVPGSSDTCVAVKGGGTGGGNASCGANCGWNTAACATPTISCGNNVRDLPFFGIGGEQCDGTDLGGATCASLGFTGGTLSCRSNCYLDSSACTRPPPAPAQCGNGALDATEQCDSSSGAALPACSSFGASRTGTVGCDANCTLDLSACTPVEHVLDTTSLSTAIGSPGFNFTGTGFFDGVDQVRDEESNHSVWAFSAPHSDANAWSFVLAANREDYVDLEALCGNGTVDTAEGEECEPGATQACNTFPGGLWNGGDATCNDCLWDQSACTTPAMTSCGDGSVTGGEECDGTGASCADLGFEGQLAPLTCLSNCSLDVEPCSIATLVELARYNVVFDPTTREVVSVNGIPYPATRPTIELGGTTTPGPYGTLPDGTPGGQIAGTGAYKTMGHAANTLTVDFGDIRQTASIPGILGGNFAQSVSLRARAGEDDGNDVPGRGVCDNDFDCRYGWNNDSVRFETTHDTLGQIGGALASNPPATVEANPGAFVFGEWTRLSRNAIDKWKLTSFATPVDRPAAARPTTCGTPTFDEIDIATPSQVVLVLDRSGSMSQEDAGGFAGTQRRLDFVKAAGRVFVDLYSDSSRPASEFPEIGLVWFNDTTFTAFGGPGSLRQLVRGTCGSAASPCANPNEIGHEYIKTEFLRDESDPAGENPTPEGLTSIGAAIREAGSLFPAATGGLQGIVLLSDGENNPPDGVTDEPIAEADALLADPAKNVRFFTIPAVDGDAILNTELARKSGGEMFPVDQVDQLPPRFMDSFARERGEALSVDRAEVAVWRREACSGEFCFEPPPGSPPDSQDVILPVEVGARRLNVLVSTRDGDPIAAGKPDFELRDPDNILVRTQASAGVATDAFYRVASVVAPKAGNWRLRVRGSSASNAQYSYVSAHVENPLPDCFVAASPALIQDGGEVVITAHALWGREIRSGVAISGEILQPNKSLVPLSFAWDEALKAHTARVPAASLTSGKGGYEVRVRCEASSDAELVEGEDPRNEFPAAPKNAVEPFSRAASVWFHFDSSQATSLKPGTDADGDGIPNNAEPSGDFDGDGLDEAWDSDSDNDDSPDSVDPDPFNPNVPNPQTGGQCASDQVAPTIVAPPVALDRCHSDTFDYILPVTVTDASCANNAQITVTGQILSVNGKQLPASMFVGQDRRITLRIGTFVVRWTATDVNGNVRTLDQTITVSAQDTVAACCTQGQTVINGNGFPNVFVYPFGGPYCIFGRGSFDTLVVGEGPDFLSGGDGIDVLVTGSSGDVCSGGPGNDIITLPVGDGFAYGGSGNDVIEVTGAGVIYGNAGDDQLIGVLGDHTMVPGPGRDTVTAGPGNDSVYIYDVCELSAFEVLDGSFGNDTLYTPVPVLDLIARGVVVVGFENIVVTAANRHLSECF